ncbi:DNA polymerase subunit beta [Gordoniibacillus kamchatkensis]|uniref:DNA polymerase subunit beta n=1 Tax=Gordoniibacillus kamchatkensis TaxID=1590651 RepID=A0ABR5AGD7_9BACL|nr:nucleotidyltransferase domain-containing protein [Paenibacillus sp. VKM B-2647]KIL40067.1 DNA polymerase subunit beta [Paenibacillus sp. VKM B-2647]
MDATVAETIDIIVSNLKSVRGIAGVVLGGSRAKGTHTPKSDIDIGIYYESEQAFDLQELGRIATALDDEHREGLMTKIGEWGPWINGGGWLNVRGMPVDFLLRDVRKVSRVIDDCLAGEVTIDYYPGHPHGFVNAIYMAEAALCRILWDAQGAVQELKAKTSPYSPALKKAVIAKFLWEASFSLIFARKSVLRKDAYHAAGCCFRSVSCLNQALFALNECYWMNETGAMDIIGSFAALPHRYTERVNEVFTRISAEPEAITEAVSLLQHIVREVEQIAG